MPVPPVVPRAATASRRTALGGALAAVVAVSACDLGRPADQPAEATGESSGVASGEPSGASSGDPSTPPPVVADDPDTALVEEVLGELAQLSSLVAGAARLPPLRAPMRALGALHEAHREALDGEPVTEPPPNRELPGPAEALRRVRAREQRAQRQLAAWSVAAESGALARLLASMSAGVAQHVAALPTTVGADR